MRLEFVGWYLLMKTLLVLSIAIFALGFGVRSQTLPQVAPCHVTLDEFPTVQELRLGTSSLDARNKFELSPTPSSRGHGDRIYYWSRRLDLKPLTSKFAELRFLDDRLFGFAVRFDFGTRYETIESYAMATARSYRLPINGWTYFTLDYRDGSGQASMNCHGFTVRISLHKIEGSEYLLVDVEDINSKATIDLRRYLSEKEKASKRKDKKNR